MRHILPGLLIRTRHDAISLRRIIEPMKLAYWIIDSANVDIIQHHRRGKWSLRVDPREGSKPACEIGPMTLREALVRVKLGVL